MDCTGFGRWLDEGCPAAESPDAHAHAAVCIACSRALAAAEELDALLSMPAGRAPAGFTGRVMARVVHAGEAGLEMLAAAETLPWWVRVASDPAVALGMALAAVVVWQRETLLAAGAKVLAIMQSHAAGAALAWLSSFRVAPDLGPFAQPLVLAGLALALLPLAWLAGSAAYHWSGDPRPLALRR
jgi:hypothetical protein